MAQGDKKKEFLSVVMPAYNEEEIIKEVVCNFCKGVLSKFENKEFIIINDCSKDGTLKILDDLVKKMQCLRIFHNEVNQGHGKSLRRAYDVSQGDLIFHIDSDNQFETGEFWKLYEKLKQKNLDGVLGYRKKRYDNFHRLIITRILRVFNFLFFGVWIQDSNTPFKLHTREALNKLLAVVPKDAFAPSLMMAIAAKKLGIKIEEIPVKHLPRLTGKVSIVRWGLIKVCFGCVKELLNFRKKINNINNNG